ncbi:TPA: hypothetical protein HA280_00875 [Candidatus Woesearchaeota archaeon]|nr:hypothetical protein [Candidatus Woesearchaeota archaeon]
MQPRPGGVRQQLRELRHLDKDVLKRLLMGKLAMRQRGSMRPKQHPMFRKQLSTLLFRMRMAERRD